MLKHIVSYKPMNHFGSQSRERAIQFYMGNVLPEANFNIDRTGYGKYRIETDLMEHKMLGRNTILNIRDGLWVDLSSGGKPVKFMKPPFDNDSTSSVFISINPEATKSVLYEFLMLKFSNGNTHSTKLQTPVVANFLHQVYDSSNWPEDNRYDPGND